MSGRVAGRWPKVVIAVVVATAALLSLPGARAQESRKVHVLFTQQDVVQAFDPITGKGVQVGTATGAIAGTTFVEFQLAPAGPPVGDGLPITFENKVTVTDIDGDQLFFDNDGSGTFRGSGGTLTGTYVVTGGTGKYQQWKIGTTFTHRAIITIPPSPPGTLGSAYVVVSDHDSRKR